MKIGFGQKRSLLLQKGQWQAAQANGSSSAAVCIAFSEAPAAAQVA